MASLLRPELSGRSPEGAPRHLRVRRTGIGRSGIGKHDSLKRILKKTWEPPQQHFHERHKTSWNILHPPVLTLLGGEGRLVATFSPGVSSTAKVANGSSPGAAMRPAVSNEGYRIMASEPSFWSTHFAGCWGRSGGRGARAGRRLQRAICNEKSKQFKLKSGTK
jgi:hypothetical protein